MSEHFEVRWDSYGVHGAHSEGRVGKFSSREEAGAERPRQEEEFALACERQPLADTDFCVVRVLTDEYGNRSED